MRLLLLLLMACVPTPPTRCQVDITSTPDLVRFEIHGECLSSSSHLSYELELPEGRIVATGRVAGACPDLSVMGEIALTVTTPPVLHATITEVDDETRCAP